MFAKARIAVLSALFATTFALDAHATPSSDSEGSVSDKAGRVAEIVLDVGEQRVLPSQDVQSYSEAVPGIVDVRLTKTADQFIIVALRPGTTTLLFLMRDGGERHYRLMVRDGENETSARVGTVEAKDNVRLDFYFVQVNRSYSHNIGIGWPTSVAPTLDAAYDLPTRTLTEATAVVSDQALPRLDLAQSGGWAKLKKQATVIAANGEKATFSGGGEVNILSQTPVSIGVQSISFGSALDVLPMYDAESGRIELKIHADISDLDDNHGTGIPGRITSTLDTVVNLELGQSLILAGLSSRKELASKSGLPLLSQIPILGALFGTHRKDEDDSENIVVIVPTVVDAVSMQSRERLRSALDTYRNFTGDIDEVNLIPDAPPQQIAPTATKRPPRAAP